jgi:DNA-binding CsgD family transcriptional regulator
MTAPSFGPSVVTRPRIRRGGARLDFEKILGQLKLAVLVFEGPKVVFRNEFTNTLEGVIRAEHDADLLVLLRDYVLRLLANTESRHGLSVVRMPKGGHITMEFTQLDSDRMLVCVRWPRQDVRAVAQHYGLSPREYEVAALVLRGLSNRAIAETLSIKSDTVKKHMTRVFDKVGVDSRVQFMSLVG